MKRPAMAELIRYLDKHPHNQYVVIFDDLKRFARDRRFHWDLKAAFKSRNTPIECLNFRFEETPEGEFVEAVFAAQGQLEREQNRRQVIQKQKARLELGYWPFYPPPGYTQVKDEAQGKVLEPNTKALVIAEAFGGFASGRFREQSDVQAFLKKQNFLGGKPIHLSLVKRLLTRIIYAGYIEFPQWEVARRKGHHEAIISLDTYEKVQKKFRGITFKVNKRDEDFPLRGLLICSKCGRKLTAGWSSGRNKPYPYYRCQRIFCKSKDVRKEKIEGLFFELLKRLKPKSGIIELARRIILKVWDKKVKNFSNVVEGYESQKNGLIRNRNQLIDKITVVKSEDVIRKLEEKVSELRIEIEEIDQLIENSKEINIDYGTVADFVLSLLENPAFVWEKGSYDKKQLITKLVFVENPIYDRELGYGTANLSAGIKLFEQISDFQYQDVEMPVLKPDPRQIFDILLRDLADFMCFDSFPLNEQNKKESKLLFVESRTKHFLQT